MRSSIILIHCWTKPSVKLQVLTVFWGYFSRVSKVTEGNFIKINLKKKSHVKGYALRGAGLRKQVKGVFVGVGVLVFFKTEALKKYMHLIKLHFLHFKF